MMMEVFQQLMPINKMNIIRANWAKARRKVVPITPALRLGLMTHYC
jgi:hypothetical protein